MPNVPLSSFFFQTEDRLSMTRSENDGSESDNVDVHVSCKCQV